MLELTHALGEPPWVCFLCYVRLSIPLFWEAGLAGPEGEVTPYCPMSPSALLILEAGLSVCPVTASTPLFSYCSHRPGEGQVYS